MYGFDFRNCSNENTLLYQLKKAYFQLRVSWFLNYDILDVHYVQRSHLGLFLYIYTGRLESEFLRVELSLLVVKGE